MKRTLTAQFVDRVKAPESQRVEVWDTKLRGLGLRITSRGIKTWAVVYRNNFGKQRRYTLGRYPDLTLSDARTGALGILRSVAKGEDPAEEKQKVRETAKPPQSVAVRDLVRIFIERYAKPNNRSWRETERVLELYVVSAWGDRQVKEIGRQDVILMLDGIMDRGTPYMANRVLAATKRLFNWAIERGLLETSPVARIRAPGKEVARDRVLCDDEIKSIWQACVGLGWPFGYSFQFLLLTAQRREEVANLKWTDLDFKNSNWSLPRDATKSGRAHEVPLSSSAIDILRQAPRLGEYVFTIRGDRPISGFSKAKRTCDETSNVADWRIHDLRRTAASGMARLGIAPHVVEKILNHSSGIISGVAAIYNRHGHDCLTSAPMGQTSGIA